jgi:hypothetical protein
MWGAMKWCGVHTGPDSCACGPWCVCLTQCPLIHSAQMWAAASARWPRVLQALPACLLLSNGQPGGLAGRQARSSYCAAALRCGHATAACCTWAPNRAQVVAEVAAVAGGCSGVP